MDYYNIIPSLLIIISMVIVIAIILRHMSELAAINTDSMETSLEDRLKKKIIISRLKNILKSRYITLNTLLNSAFNYSSNVLRNIKEYIFKLEHYYQSLYYRSLKMQKSKAGQAVKELVESAKDSIKKNKPDQAKQKYLQAIELDPKNPELYEMLAHLYWDYKEYADAANTILYIIELRTKLNLVNDDFENNSFQLILGAHYLDLALIYKDMENYPASISAFQEALRVQPNHPRYLALLLDVAILTQNKELATDVLGKLKNVNPENEKISEYEKELRSL